MEENEVVAQLIKTSLCHICGEDLREPRKKPLIAVVNSFMEYSPGDLHLRKLGELIKESVSRAGGAPVEIGIPGFCGELKANSAVRRYYFAYRDLAAAMAEILLRFHGFDGAVFLCTCDNQIPAFVLAALRVNIPSLFLTGGYMMPGTFEGREVTAFSVAKQYGRYLSGNATEESVQRMACKACPTPGACPEMGTANTMAVLAEAMGLAIPGASSVPAASARQEALARRAGEAILAAVERNLRPRDIVTEKTLENAIRVCLAIGGSTNAMIHIAAYEKEIGAALDRDCWNKLSGETPFLCAISPNRAGHYMKDYDEAGGTKMVLKALEPLLHGDVLRHDGRTLREELAAVTPRYGETIRPLDDPFSPDGGLVVVRGNLAPDGGLIKKSAVAPERHVFRGKAKVYDSEEAAVAAVEAGQVVRGDVLVIRYEGPRAGPGSREVVSILHILAGKGIQDEVAVVTDGRMSGTNLGLAVCNISPEAWMGTALSVAEDGDEILLDIPRASLELLVPEETVRERLRNWKQPGEKEKSGYLALYGKNVSQLSEGARLI